MKIDTNFISKSNMEIVNKKKSEKHYSFPESYYIKFNEKNKNSIPEFNPNKATFDELVNFSTELYNKGMISLADHSFMTFEPSKSPQSFKFSKSLSSYNEKGQKDWIKEYELRANEGFKSGDIKLYSRNKEIVQLLYKYIKNLTLYSKDSLWKYFDK